MTCFKILCLTLWTVSVLNDCNAEEISDTNSTISERTRTVMEDEWTWGYYDKTIEDKAQQSDPTTTNKPRVVKFERQQATPKPADDLPCERPLWKKPDFRAPGRRLCEIKCDEYIWELKFRENKANNTADCVEYRKTHPDFLHTAAVGGRDAFPGEFPHMAAIGWEAVTGTYIFKCGGSLISENFVLTAAHCTTVPSADTTVANVAPVVVRLGSKNILDTPTPENNFWPETANIVEIIRHPEYKSPKQYFDIALLKLKWNLKFTNNVQPACLWPHFDTKMLGTKATLTGWGVVETAGRTTSPILQAAVVDIVDSKTCDDLLRPNRNRNWGGIKDDQICAGIMAGGVDACQGDSGGPLQVKIDYLPPSPEGKMYYVIGVTSFGFSCALPNTPGVYTRVSNFIDWIENIVWKEDAN